MKKPKFTGKNFDYTEFFDTHIQPKSRDEIIACVSKYRKENQVDKVFGFCPSCYESDEKPWETEFKDGKCITCKGTEIGYTNVHTSEIKPHQSQYLLKQMKKPTAFSNNKVGSLFKTLGGKFVTGKKGKDDDYEEQKDFSKMITCYIVPKAFLTFDKEADIENFQDRTSTHLTQKMALILAEETPANPTQQGQGQGQGQ